MITTTKAILIVVVIAAITASAMTTVPWAQATTGMGGGNPGSGKDNPQPDRVGADDDGVVRDGADDEGESNCWGKVTSDAAQEFGSGFGQHAANPTGDEDNDTPREGVGNQDEDHPSDHADSVGPAFDGDDDVECDND